MKKVLLLLVLVFVGFWMFTDPSGLAQNARDGARELWELLVSLFDAIIRFVNALF